jgi:hypothetical protein
VSPAEETARLIEISGRLEQITAELSGDAGEERAEDLTKEAAELAAEAVEEVNRRLREGLPGGHGADDPV